MVVMVVVRWNICYDSGWMVVCGQKGDKSGLKMVWKNFKVSKMEFKTFQIIGEYIC